MATDKKLPFHVRKELRKQLTEDRNLRRMARACKRANSITRQKIVELLERLSLERTCKIVAERKTLSRNEILLKFLRKFYFRDDEHRNEFRNNSGHVREVSIMLKNDDSRMNHSTFIPMFDAIMDHSVPEEANLNVTEYPEEYSIMHIRDDSSSIDD